MALTLPYPSLVFVPLDVLTADQLNEIVSNYEYIANQFPIAASNVDFSTFGENFSESEVATDFTWIDGKTVYKKTVVIGAFSGTGTFSKAHGISNLSVPIMVSGFALDGGAGEFKTLPYVRPDVSYSGISIAVSSTDIRIGRNAGYNISNSWVTIWYTKSS